jgi:hypothetical protein
MLRAACAMLRSSSTVLATGSAGMLNFGTVFRTTMMRRS